jgi:CO/xanthine dehydrogenase FAD-binding subunit
MKPAQFRYHAPKTIEEAVDTLAEVAGEDGRVLAGGQSLVPIMAFRLARPAHLVDINGVEALRRLTVESSPSWCVTSPIIRFAPAARSAAASRMPTRRPNGAWSRRRSAQKWWRDARPARAPFRRRIFSAGS